MLALQAILEHTGRVDVSALKAIPKHTGELMSALQVIPEHTAEVNVSTAG